MRSRWWGGAALAALAAFALTGCSTARYQERIASLERDNAGLVQQNQELQSEKRALSTQLAQEMSKARPRPEVVPAAAPKEDPRLKEMAEAGFKARSKDGQTTVTLESSVLFDSGSATLTRSGKEVLSKLAGIVKSKYAAARYRVEGHTDNQPIKMSRFRNNWDLSAERAVGVLEYLTKDAGIEEGKFEIVGYADTRPVADNSAEAGRKQNRRVEIVIVE
ncbi:MAG: OmpA family protein [Planctomycetes bacterium]|nr:OmpA family protein [Planctomycetota bacterium]